MKRWVQCWACLAMLGLAAVAYGSHEHGDGNGKHDEACEIAIPLKMVPPAVKKAVKKAFPEVIIQEAGLEIEGDEIEFVLEGMRDGKKVEVEVECIFKIDEVELEDDEHTDPDEGKHKDHD